MPARRRGGGSAAGGGNASVSFLLRQAGEENKGLLFSSPRIDETGHLRGESKGEADPALGGHVDLPIFAGPGVDRHGALRLQFPADITGFAGADSNNIVVRLFRNDSFVRTPTVTWNAASGLLLIILSGTVAVSDIRTAIDDLSDITIANSLTGAATGSDNLVVPGSNGGHVNHNAQGGRDEIPPGIDLLAQPDDEVNGPNILVKYDPADETTLQALLDELEENDQGVTIKVPFGTDLTAAPEAVPFVRVYQGNIAESPSTGTGGLTQGQVDGRVRALSKASALRGGPPVPVSDLPGADALDAEVPGLVEGAAETQAPDGHQDDELLFIGRSGGLKKATTQTFRQLFKGYVGAWPVAAGFVFRPGDITDHTGRFYIVNTRHVVDTTDGPETNLNYTPLDNWVGTIAQGWYRAGSTGIYQGGIYAAIADVVNTDALPGINHPKWLLISQDSRAILDGGTYRSASTYKGRRIVRKADAAYLTLRDVPAGIDPGVANNWADYYYRLGWVDGDPSSIVDVDFDTGTGELVSRTRGGTENRKAVPTGGTVVGPNPAGTDGDDLTRLAIAGVNYKLPGFRPQLIGSADFGSASNTNWKAHVSGDGIDKPAVIPDGEWWGVTFGDRATAGDQVYIFPAAKIPAEAVEAGQTTGGGRAGARLAVDRMNRGIRLAFNAAGKLVVASDNTGTDIEELSLFRVGQGDDPVDGPVHIQPTISSFTLVSGEQHPVAGSIAGDRYNLAWQIAQPDHVGAARIIGFKGAYGDGTGATVLRTIDAGASAEGHPNIGYANGETGILMPNGLSLAAGETYTLRLQVFGEGVTNPALAASPAAYQDIVITAHAAATALYHSGRLPYDSNDADAAATAARIVFATHDTQTWGALPSEFTLDLPDDGADYQAYFAAASSAAQPSGFTLSNQPATQGFTEVTETIGGVEYKVWIQKPNYRVTHDTENGNTYGVTP